MDHTSNGLSSGGARGGTGGAPAPLLLCNKWSPPKPSLQFSTMNQEEKEKNEEEEEEKKRGKEEEKEDDPP